MEGSILYQFVVIDDQDPVMLGRIRAKGVTNNEQETIRAVTDPPLTPADYWTERDPLVFQPLMPYYLYQTPKKDEMVLVMYNNPSSPFVNRFYIQSSFYSPTSTGFQYWAGGDKFMGTGTRFQQPVYLKNADGSQNNKYFGVFPQPGDNSLLGRGSSDLIIKKEEVLIRAGKYLEESLRPNELPLANNRRAFFQLSRFQNTIEKLPTIEYTELKEVLVPVQYLIEYYISNPENDSDKFGGSIFLYQLKPSLTTNSKFLNVGSKVPESVKYLIYNENFMQLSKKETIAFINNFIKNCNNTNYSSTGVELFPQVGTKFPIFYRPSILNYSLLTDSSSSPTARKHFGEIYNQIKLYESLVGGYGLIYTKDKVGTPTRLETKVLEREKRNDVSGTYGAIGSDKLFLLSHLSSIPGKKKINFDDTLYGISAEKFGREIIPNTSSMVRGEELLELINLIVKFLVTHTHPFPGYPPITISKDGTQAQTILTEIQNSTNKILNKHIRIN